MAKSRAKSKAGKLLQQEKEALARLLRPVLHHFCKGVDAITSLTDNQIWRYVDAFHVKGEQTEAASLDMDRSVRRDFEGIAFRIGTKVTYSHMEYLRRWNKDWSWTVFSELKLQIDIDTDCQYRLFTDDDNGTLVSVKYQDFHDGSIPSGFLGKNRNIQKFRLTCRLYLPILEKALTLMDCPESRSAWLAQGWVDAMERNVMLAKLPWSIVTGYSADPRLSLDHKTRIDSAHMLLLLGFTESLLQRVVEVSPLELSPAQSKDKIFYLLRCMGSSKYYVPMSTIERVLAFVHDIGITIVEETWAGAVKRNLLLEALYKLRCDTTMLPSSIKVLTNDVDGFEININRGDPRGSLTVLKRALLKQILPKICYLNLNIRFWGGVGFVQMMTYLSQRENCESLRFLRMIVPYTRDNQAKNRYIKAFRGLLLAKTSWEKIMIHDDDKNNSNESWLSAIFDAEWKVDELNLSGFSLMSSATTEAIFSSGFTFVQRLSFGRKSNRSFSMTVGNWKIQHLILSNSFLASQEVGFGLQKAISSQDINAISWEPTSQMIVSNSMGATLLSLAPLQSNLRELELRAPQYRAVVPYDITSLLTQLLGEHRIEHLLVEGRSGFTESLRLSRTVFPPEINDNSYFGIDFKKFFEAFKKNQDSLRTLQLHGVDIAERLVIKDVAKIILQYNKTNITTVQICDGDTFLSIKPKLPQTNPLSKLAQTNEEDAMRLLHITHLNAAGIGILRTKTNTIIELIQLLLNVPEIADLQRPCEGAGGNDRGSSDRKRKREDETETLLKLSALHGLLLAVPSLWCIV